MRLLAQRGKSHVFTLLVTNTCHSPPASLYKASLPHHTQEANMSTSRERLANITKHMAPQAVSSFDALPLAPVDPLFGLVAAYKADNFAKKVDLGVGAYRDNNARPWVLPVVKKVSRWQDSSTQLNTSF